MATLTGTGPGQSQELQNPSGTPTWVAGDQAVGPSCDALPGH